MEVPSLKNIAVKAVTAYIINGEYDNLDYEFEPDLSNQIYQSHVDDGYTGTVLEQFKTKLNVTQVNFQLAKFGKDTIAMLKHQNLKSLQFGSLGCWEKKYNDENGRFKIVSSLKDLLNLDSHLNMKFLGLDDIRKYENNWTISIGNLLPNLETLSIGRFPLKTNDFKNICENFPNLKVLKINPGETRSLSGISKLKNLEVLMARVLNVTTTGDMIDLFGCKKMKMLNLSRWERKDEDPDIMKIYLRCEKSLEELRFFDCRGLRIDEAKLKKLMKTHCNLKQVVVLDTVLEYEEVSDIELLNYFTLHSLVKILEHHVANSDPPYIARIMFQIREIYFVAWEEKDIDVPLLCKIVKLACQTLKYQANYSEIVNQGIKLLCAIARETFVQLLPPKSTVALIEQLLESGKYPGMIETYNTEIWSCLSQKHILELPYLPVRKISWFAIFSLNEIKRTPPSLEYSVLEELIGRLYPEDLEKLYHFGSAIDPMISLIRFAYKQPKLFMTENRAIIKMAFGLIYEITKRSRKACHKITFPVRGMSVIQILINLCEDEWEGLPEQVTSLKIIINVMMLDNSEDQELSNSVGILKGDTNTSFCSIAILSSLICCKLPKKGFYDFWSKINLRIINLCSKREFKPTVNLNIFLNSSILKDTFLNSDLDGPKIWALLTMRTILEKDSNIADTLIKSGFLEIVKNYRNSEGRRRKVEEDGMSLKSYNRK